MTEADFELALTTVAAELRGDGLRMLHHADAFDDRSTNGWSGSAAGHDPGARQFPPPWRVVELPGGYAVEDSHRAASWHLHGRAGPQSTAWLAC